MNCDECVNSRTVISENGYHSVCCLSEKEWFNCSTGKHSKFISKRPKLTDEQIKNLEDDEFFLDLDAERYRLSVELYNED